MVRRVALMLTALAVASGLALDVFGCSSASPASQAPPDASSADDADDTADADSFDVHVITTPDRSDAADRDIRIDASACASPCDCDGDSFSNGQPGCPTTALDCDDFDPLVHPGQDMLSLVPLLPNVGDWDCDGIVTKQYGVGKCVAGIASCASSIPGLANEAECGSSATYVSCAATSPLGGSPNCNFTQIPVVQGCR